MWWKHRTKRGVAEPLIVEWPDSARGKLESVSRRGLVAVRYEGCELSVLARCTVKSSSGGYGYSPITRKQSKVTIRDADELYASMPVGAVKLEGKLQSAGQLNVAMTIVGRYEAPTPQVYRDELDGDCSEATHVIAALTVGSFTFSAGADAEVGGGASVGGVGGGAKSTAARETIQHDGDEASCAKATSSDKGPPEGCGALLQIEVMPLAKGSKPVAAVVPVPAPVPIPTPSATPSVSDNTPPPVAKPIKCKKNEHAEDGVCVKGPAPKTKPVAKPAAGITASASAMPTCAPGQHVYNSRCVDDEPPPKVEPPPQPQPQPQPEVPTCVAGTHLENGACVVDSAGSAHGVGQPYGAGDPQTPDEQANPWRVTLAYLGIGAAIAGTSAGLIALSSASSAKEECSESTKTCSGEYEGKRKTAMTTAIIADVSFGVAALAFLGVFLLPSKVKVGVTPTQGGAFAGASGRF